MHRPQAGQDAWLTKWTSDMEKWQLQPIGDFDTRFYIMVYFGLGFLTIPFGLAAGFVYTFATLHASQVRCSMPPCM